MFCVIIAVELLVNKEANYEGWDYEKEIRGYYDGSKKGLTLTDYSNRLSLIWGKGYGVCLDIVI